MAEPFSTNELFLRSDRIAFGKIPPEVPERLEQTLILPDTTGSKLYFGLSSLVSTSGLTGTLETIYPQFASFTFDNLNKRLGINNSTPQYAIDISTTTGVRIQGGTLIANATGLVSVPTASLFSTLPTYVFAPGTIPPTAIASTGGSILPGISVPTSALFSTLPTSIFAPSSIPLVALQSSGIIVASSFVGDGYYLSNIPLANINGTVTGDFFRPNSIPLSTLASTGQIWIREPTGSIFVPILSTGQLLTSSIYAPAISTVNLTTNQFIASSIQANDFQSAVFSASNLSAINLKASSIEVVGLISSGRFAGDGESITNLTPAFLNNVIPSDKFGYRLISFDALNPYGNFLVIAGTATFNQAVPVTVQGVITASTFQGGYFRGDGGGLYNINAISTASLTSSVRGLGTAGYVSTLSLTSSLQGLGTLNYVSTASLVSTVVGLSHSGYVSSTQVISTIEGLGTLGYVSSTQLTSTLDGLATTGYISSTQLTSTVRGLATIGYISSTQLISTLEGLATFGFVSSTQLTSTVTGLASSRYISTTQLTSTVFSLNTNLTSTSFGKTEELASSLTGLATLGFVSSTQLTSTVTGLASSRYISTTQLTSTVFSLNTNLTSTSFGKSQEVASSLTGLATLGFVSSTQLVSSLRGLGTIGYISTTQLTSTVVSLNTNLTSTSFGKSQEVASSLTGLATLGFVSSTQLVSTVRGLEFYVSSFIDPTELASTITSTVFGLGVEPNLVSTVKGLGTVGYVSSLSLVSTTLALQQYVSSFIDPTELASTITSTVFGLGVEPNLVSTVAGLGTAGYVSTSYLENSFSTFSTAMGQGVNPFVLTSTIEGLGTFGYVSSLSLVSTTLALQQYVSSFIDPTELASTITSTVFGLGVEPNLVSTVAGLGTAGYVSTSYLENSFSTFSTAMGQGVNPFVLTSTIEGLGTFGYVSSLSLVSTTLGLQDYISSFIDPTELASTVTSTVFGLGLDERFASTVEGLGSAGYVSTLSLQSSMLAVEQNLSSFSTSYGLTFNTSSLTTNVLSSLFVTADNITGRYSVFVEDGTLSVYNQTGLSPTTFTLATSNIDMITALGAGAELQWNMTVYDADRRLAFFSKNTGSDVLTLTSTGLVGIGKIPKVELDISGITTTTALNTTSISTGDVYLSTLHFYDLSTPSFVNLLAVSSGILYLNGQMIQGGGGDVTTGLLVSTVEGLGTVGYISSPQLISTVEGIITGVVDVVNNLGTYGYVSTATLEYQLSSFSTALGATGGGLATIPSTLSTFALLTSSIQASTISTIFLVASTIITNTINASTGVISSFSTNTINFAGGFGYLTMPDIYPNTVYTSTVTTSNLLVGVNSVVSPIQFFGFGNYTNSVLAELSTGATTQELLMFRGSNASDRIRFQTTGSLVFEPGVSARLWPTVPSNVTPAMVINTSSNIGIQTASPTVPLDVAGAIRGISLSTQQIVTSSIANNPSIAGAVFTSSVRFLGPSTFLQGGFSTSFMTAGPQEIDFFTNGSQRMTILSNGNVGISIINPTFTLDVGGTTRLSTLFVSSVTAYNSLSTVVVQTSSFVGNNVLGNVTSTLQMGASTFTGKWNDAQYYVLQTI